MRVVQVLPQTVGWTVEGCGEPQLFSSGRSAEQAARRLLAAMADAYGRAELRICDRSGRAIGFLRQEGASPARLEFA